MPARAVTLPDRDQATQKLCFRPGRVTQHLYIPLSQLATQRDIHADHGSGNASFQYDLSRFNIAAHIPFCEWHANSAAHEDDLLYRLCQLWFLLQCDGNIRHWANADQRKLPAMLQGILDE